MNHRVVTSIAASVASWILMHLCFIAMTPNQIFSHDSFSWAAWTGMFTVLLWLLYAIPIATFTSAQIQFRYWHFVIFGAVVVTEIVLYAFLMLSDNFATDFVTRARQDSIFLEVGALQAALSASLYLVLLRHLSVPRGGRKP